MNVNTANAQDWPNETRQTFPLVLFITKTMTLDENNNCGKYNQSVIQSYLV